MVIYSYERKNNHQPRTSKNRKLSRKKTGKRLFFIELLLFFGSSLVLLLFLRFIGVGTNLLFVITGIVFLYGFCYQLHLFTKYVNNRESNGQWPRAFLDAAHQDRSRFELFQLGVSKLLYALAEHSTTMIWISFSIMFLLAFCTTTLIPTSILPPNPDIQQTVAWAVGLRNASSDITQDPVSENPASEDSVSENPVSEEVSEIADSSISPPEEAVSEHDDIENWLSSPSLPVLPEEECMELLFMSGEYTISPETPLQSAVSIVQSFLNRYHPPCKEETLSRTSQNTQAILNELSKQEPTSIDELNDVIHERTDIYNDNVHDPYNDMHHGQSYDLAQLIANNYYYGSLLYYTANPRFSLLCALTSIHWRFETLEFCIPDAGTMIENGESKSQFIYKRIKQTYKDIKDQTELPEEIREQAALLTEVFKMLEESCP